MPGSLTLSIGTLYAFLLVLTRVGCALIFVPLPGIRAVPELARAVLATGFTLALAPRWPQVAAEGVAISVLLRWAASEAAVGCAIGLCVAVVLETFSFAAQVLGLQAGYAYASTIDPNSEADSGVLLVMAQMVAGLLFFALGLDREVLRLFATSLDKVPPGTYIPGPSAAQSVIRLGSSIFTVGLRLAFPVVALLVLVDVALALLGRLNAQLQLLTLAFPAKMLVALMVLSSIVGLFPRILIELSGHAWTAAARALGL